MTVTNSAQSEAFNLGDFINLTHQQGKIKVEPTDLETVQAIRRGEEAAFERTFRTYYERLCQYAGSMLKDEADAEEVVQTVFLNIWEKREVLEITLSLKSYLYRAVHNYCLNRFKHEAIKKTHQEYSRHFLSGHSESVAEAIQAQELQERIDAAIEKLPEQCGIAFRMSRFEELKYQEIASRLGISIKTVENQIGKALKILRLELADYLPLMMWYVYFLCERVNELSI
ncbi:RNA polymerase sigma-70 factor [Dyadobacter tibetensis]|uniref:RNA polymerase sigma-70 factor n=1 Tax=Dyadobacter tibetensis TaxID=1211851 RepID=UPI0004BB4133|nr:RNA polymerase sigma-70 factor [Dyadobacter tibetensis]